MIPRNRFIQCALALLFAGAGSAVADVTADVRAPLSHGDPNGALQLAERAAAANPKDPQARFLHGVGLMDLRRDDAAMDVFMQLTQEYPELPDPYNNIALLHARAGRLEAAQQALETALRNDPGHRAARTNLGQVHLMLAVQAFEAAAAAGPLDAPVQRLLDGARTLVAARPGTATAR